MQKAEQGIAVYGELRPRRMTEEIPSGHVYIEILAKDGANLVEVSTHYHRIGKLFKKPQRYSFSATIPVMPPEGSTIRLRFEETP